MIIVPAGDKTDLVAAYVTEKTGDSFAPEMYQAMAILDDDYNFQGGVVIHKFTEYDCYMSTATETPLAWRPPVLNGLFDYVFNQLGCVRCTALIKKNNKKSRALVEHAGFVLEGNIRKGYEGVKDIMLYGLLAEECVYIQEVGSDEQDRAEAAEAVAPAVAEAIEAVAPVFDGHTGSGERGKVEEFW